MKADDKEHPPGQSDEDRIAHAYRPTTEGGLPGPQELWEMALKYARKAVLDRQEAKDIASYVRDKLMDPTSEESALASTIRSVPALVAACVRNRFKDLRRMQLGHERKEEHIVRHVLETQRVLDPSQVFARTERAEAIERALRRLPPERRKACVLYFMRDLSYAEVAFVLKKKQRTIEKHVELGTKQLAPWLRDYDPNTTDTEIQ